MVKEPRPGRVKTRLGRDIGMVEAAHWFRKQVFSTLIRLKDPRWDTCLAVEQGALSSRVWSAHVPRLSQGRGDLGMRMARVLRASGRRPTCLIGGDIPNITKPHIQAAFTGLGSHSAVIGPATDGGYWLIGLRHPMRQPCGFLTQVRWSSEWAMVDTLASAPNLTWAQTAHLSDVDTADDLRRMNSL